MGETQTTRSRSTLRWLAAGLMACVGLAAGSYAIYAGVRWLRYGHAAPPVGDEADALLDRFMPVYDVVERRHIRVAAPPEITLRAASEMDIQQSRIIRAIFGARARLLGDEPERAEEVAGRPRGLLAWSTATGWAILAEIPGCEVVFGALAQPWEANAVFRTLQPAEFATFREPGYIKIAWTLRADPAGGGASIFRHETRVVATDPTARELFRRYWAIFSPGIVLIRWLVLDPIKRDAERRAGEATSLLGSAPPTVPFPSLR